jgi:hypothetical protein
MGIGTPSPNGRLEVRGVETEVSPLYEQLVAFGVSGGFIGGFYRDFNGSGNYIGLESFNVGNTSKRPLVFQEFGGNVGIGTAAPGERLHVAGNICATGTIGACSDARFKTNVMGLTEALDRITRLRGVSFDWKRQEFADHQFADGRQVGFIAQEVEKVLPQVVSKGSDGYLSVDYGRLTPMVVEAIKEQQTEVELLRAEKDCQLAARDLRIAELESRLEQLESMMKRITTNLNGGVR